MSGVLVLLIVCVGVAFILFYSFLFSFFNLYMCLI